MIPSTNLKKNIKGITTNYQLYIFVLPAFLYIIIFQYGAMFGIQIAFKDYFVLKGFGGSPWVGLKYFSKFFNSVQFWMLMKNTVGLSLYSLVVGFPLPIILALQINYIRNNYFKSFVQTITYAPHFISTVVMVSMLLIFLSPKSGMINFIINNLGGTPVNFIAQPEWFKTIYVLSNLWQSTGWSAIIYIAALSGVSKDLYEAAIIDGATKMKMILHIDLPGIMPTIVILLILNIGGLMNVGFEQVFLMQNALNITSSQVIQTYVYKVGLINNDVSYSTAIGLFNSIINFILLIGANKLSKKLTDVTLW